MIKDKSLVKSFVGTVSISLFARGLAVVSGIIYARVLGPEEYGLFAYVMSILSLLTLPVVAGLPGFIVREVANFQLEGRWQYLRGIINWSRWYVLITSIIIITISLVVIYFDFFKTSVASLLCIALAIIPFRGLLIQQGAILNGFRKPVLALIPSQILSPVITLGFLFFLILGNRELTGKVIIEISIVAYLMAFVLSAWFLNQIIIQESKAEKPKYLIKKWHLSLTPFTLMAILGTLNTELASVFLGWFDTAKSVAFFKVAIQGVLLIALGLTSVNSIIMPRIARFYRQGDFEGTQKLLTKSVQLSCLVSLPIIFILIFFGKLAISMLFGNEYLNAYPLMVILCIGQIVNVLMGSVGLVLNMTNNEKYALNSLFVTLLITIVLLFLLIPMYSSIGAATASSIGLIIWNVLMGIRLYKLTGLMSWLRLH